MKDILNWCLENIELLKDIIGLLLSLGGFTYATIIHQKSKKRLSELETKADVEENLMKTLSDLQKALERRQ